MDIIKDLQWRYATKQFDNTKKLTDDQLNELLESLRLSPSSFGLQPWKFVVVNNEKTRQDLLQHSWNQSQVVDASHLIVLCLRKDVDEEYVKNYVSLIAKERGIDKENLAQYEQMMLGFISRLSEEDKKQWMKHQIYIALGFLMHTCANLHIDACPMEGFDKAKYDEFLKLDEKQLSSVVLCPVGFRSEDDKHSQLKKVRFSQEEVVIQLN